MEDKLSLETYSKRSIKDKSIIICKSQYHHEITDSVTYDIINNFSTQQRKHTALVNVPGAFELPFGIKLVINKLAKKKSKNSLIIIAVGCVIKGETKHDEYISSTVINALRDLSLQYNVPIINGIITTLNKKQAIDRAGTKYSKGSDLVDTMNSLLELINKLGPTK